MAKIKFCKIAALTISLSLMICSSVFASTQSVSKLSSGNNYSYASVKNNIDLSNLKVQLHALVLSGNITTPQGNAVIKLLTPIRGRDGIKSELDSLVTSGTITTAQEDLLVNLTFTNITNNVINTELDDLDTSSSISEALKDAIVKLATINTANGEKKTELRSFDRSDALTKVQEGTL